MQMHRHSCKACCINGPMIYVASGEPPEEEDAPFLACNQLVSSSTRNMPLVATSTPATQNPHLHSLQQLIRPCGCTHGALHGSSYQHAHHHTQTHSRVGSCPVSMHAAPCQLVKAPKPLNMEVPASTPTRVHCHAHMITCAHAAHVHPRQEGVLSLPEPNRSLELLPKYGSGSYGTVPLTLTDPGVIDAQPIAMCCSTTAVCDKQPASTLKDVHADSPCCPTLMCMKPALSHRTHMGSDAFHHQMQTVNGVQTCQIHPRCVAPVVNSSILTPPTGNTLQLPELCKVSPLLQAQQKACVAAPMYNDKVRLDHCKEPPLADNGGNREDEFWKGATYDNNQGIDDCKGGRGSNGNGWRGRCSAWGRGFNNQTGWIDSKENSGRTDDAWKGAELGTCNARPGGRGRGRGGGRGGWQHNKRPKRENEGADWEGSKPNAFGERNNTEGSGWGNNPNNGWGNPNNGTGNGW